MALAPRPLRWRHSSIVAAAAIAFAVPAIERSVALDVRSLTGWWIAIDDTFPKLWAGGIPATEEILIVNPDGRFENRAMSFTAGGSQVCAQRRVCSDLPIIASGRLRVAGDTLKIYERRTSNDRIDTPRTDPLIRRAAMSALTDWSVAGSGSQITLRSGATTRTFAKIDTRRLQRLRAGMRASGLPADKNWRCFLANATASDAAFAPLRTGPASAPPYLDRYLRVASYLMALDARTRHAVMDDPEARNLLGNDYEEFLVEEFPGIVIPVRQADIAQLKAQVAAIENRVRAKMAESAGGAPAPQQAGRGALITDAEIAAFVQAASNDPAAKKMFCRE